jgi:glycosyltransferase involved in cell wall biosynthesis
VLPVESIMRVCLVSQEYPPDTAWGGIGTQTRNKALALTRRGHEVHVLTRAAEPGPGIRTERDGEAIVHRMQLPVPEFNVYGRGTYLLGYTWLVLTRLRQLMETCAFDLVDFPDFGGEGFAYQLDRTSFNWLPVVVHLHGPLEMFSEKMGWPQAGSRFHQVGNFLEAFSIRAADALMAASATIADLTSRYHGIPRETIDVVYSGVDAQRFQPPARGRTDPHPPTVLFVGQVVENKGIHTVIEAVLRLRSRHPDLRLVIVGGPDRRIIPQLRARLREQGIEGAVEFPGFIPPERMPEHYQAADVFCSPAEFEGGVASVYLEAMACECPVVASTAGGAADAVRHQETGLLVPPGDIAATEAALDQLLSNPELRWRMGRAGRRRVEECFTVELFIERILAVYEKALARSRESPLRLRDERE